jgi:hypothetical protein
MRSSVVETAASPADSFQASKIEKFTKDHFHELTSLADAPQRAVCKLIRDRLISDFGLHYMSKLNFAVKQQLVAQDAKGREHFCKWIDSDVMEILDVLQTTDVLERVRSLSELSNILATLASSLSSIEENEIDENMCYLFDVPYQLEEMVYEAPEIPKFQKHTVKYEGRERVEKLNVQVTGNSTTVTYKIGKKIE